MAGELNECNVLFADIVKDSDRRLLSASQPENCSSGAAQFSLNRLDLLHRRVEMLLKQLLEDFHIGNNTSA